MTEIYFIRHAESFGNLTRRIYGWYDGSVTPKGRAQIECLRKRFEEVKIDAVYSSDLKRTCETASAIYVPKKLPLYTDSAFREVGVGVWENMPWGEAPVLYPEQYKNWTESPLEFNIEGGETYDSVYARAKKALDKVARENDGKTVVIVSHGATLRMLMHGIVRDGDISDVANDAWGDNTCVSLFRFDNGRYTEVFKNDNSHLSEMPDFKENMNWVRQGTVANAWFSLAELPRDKDKICNYHREAWLEIFGDEPPRDGVVEAKAKRLLRQDKRSIAFAHCPNGEIGMIETDDREVLYPSAGHISLLYLNPDFRGMGYGIQLIGHAMDSYKARSKKHLTVRVSEKNTAALKFYKKYGFYEVSREVDGMFRQIIMALDI